MSNANQPTHDTNVEAPSAPNNNEAPAAANNDAATNAIPRLQQVHPNELLFVHPQDFRKIQEFIHDLIVALPKGTSEETVELLLDLNTHVGQVGRMNPNYRPYPLQD